MSEISAVELAADVRALIGHLKRRMREQADVADLTYAQVCALARLEREGPTTLSALSRAEGVRPQSMAATVAALQAMGHVVSLPDPNDRRQFLLSLHIECRNWLLKSRVARLDWLAGVIECELDASDRKLLAQALVLLGRVANA
ncbi:MarR family winged helix-turn-helix transcriptional regulator [Sphingobium sp. CFD-2]|uniref:MarR family winged helix-turn-helix transcriptional regulator n=1 Tax=Sphingobium sp. CFD-2 TaxID=2878542 RepID=UPI00214CB032|nr:MarR family transcriptional regulator [Sphingobium sp. CFD-2]